MDTLQSEKSFVFSWLKKYFSNDEIGIDLRDDITNVLDFGLIWSLFEKEVCHENANVTKIENFINNLRRRNIGNFDSHIQFFRERYLTNGTTNYRFDDLYIERCRRNEGYGIKQRVASILKGQKSEPSSVLWALLIISYRLRNNLFHGEKPINELREQDTLFYNVNKLIAKALELHKKLER